MLRSIKETFLLSILAFKFFIDGAPLMFPLTFGGFTSDTIIIGFIVTPSEKIFIALISADPSIINTTTFPVANFFTLFDYPNTKSYLWSKQHSDTGNLQPYLKMMDVNADETKGCILFTNKYGGSTSMHNYDLLFLSMADGSIIRQLKVSSTGLNPDRNGFLFFYNDKIYFFAYDIANSNMGFAIFNEATIGTQAFGASLTLGYMYNTINHFNMGIAKGSSAQNYIVLSLYQASPNQSNIMMIQPTSVAGTDSINQLWKFFVDVSGDYIKYIDIFEQLPNKRNIYGCADLDGGTSYRKISFFRLRSVGSSMPTDVIRFKINGPTTSTALKCSGTKGLSEDQFIVAFHQDISDEQFVMVRITIDDASGNHMIDQKNILLASSRSQTDFLTAKILDWNRILFVENNIFQSNTAIVGFSLTPASFLPIVKTINQAESVTTVIYNSQSSGSITEGGSNLSPQSIGSNINMVGMTSNLIEVKQSTFALQATAIYNNKDTCLIQYGSYTSKSVTYYIQDSTFKENLGVTLKSYFSTCNTGTCATERLDVDGNSVPTLTMGVSNGIMSVFSTDRSLIGITYQVFYRAIPPAGSITNCVYYTLVRSLKIDEVKITTSLQSNINYNFYTGSQQVNINPFKQSVTISDPIFQIVYTLKDQTTGLVYADTSLVQSQFIIAFTNTGNPVVTINSTVYSHIGSYSMVLEARFASYNPTYFVMGPPFTIQIVDTCSNTKITSNNNKTFYTLIDVGPKSFEILPKWSDSYNGVCGLIKHSTSGSVPPILSFSSATNTFNFNPLVATDAGTYRVKVLGQIFDQKVPTTQLAQASTNLNFIVISSKTTFLTPQPVADIYYFVGDPIIKINLPKFSNSDPNFSVLYNVTTITNQTLDPSIMGVQQMISNPYIEIYTTQVNKIGFYAIQLVGFYNIPIQYSVSTPFNVILINKCTLNLIQSASLLSLTYTVGATKLLTTFNSWSMNMTQCGPILGYTMKTQSGLPMPGFISFDGNLRIIGIQTNDPQFSGAHQFIVQGLTKYYSPSSTSTSEFNLTINCDVKTINRQPPSSSWKVQVGTFTTQAFDFGKISFDPDCPKYDISTSVIFEASMGGQPLPPYLQYDISKNQYVITSSASMITGPVILGLKVTVMRASTQVVSQTFLQNLVINPQIEAAVAAATLPSVPTEYMNAINLPSINLQCKVGETTEYVSPDFTPKLQNGELYSLVNPKQIGFIILGQQTLKIKPTQANQGLRYRVFLKAEDVQIGQQYLQTINIEVESTDMRILKQLTGEIVQISRTGLVDIRFSQIMLVPSNLTYINATFLALRVKDRELRLRNNINFTWNVTNFKGSFMQIKIYFQDPLQISVETSDWLEIEVLDNSLFMSIESSEFLNITYQMRKKLPNQLDSGSQFLDSMSQSLKEKLGALMSSSAGSATTAFLLNRIWGMVNSVQIVMLLPLGDVKLPANIHLTTSSIQSNTQHEIFKAISFDNFEFKNTTPFSKEFEEQGYDSFFVIDNLRPIYKNINMFLMLTGLLLLIAILIKIIFKKEIKIFEMLKNLIVFNFLIKLIIENSLQLSVFSLVNLQESFPKNNNEIISMIFATLYLLAVISICIFNALKVRKLTKDDCHQVIVKNPTVAVLYQLLDRFNPRCLYYFSVFIGRRLITSLVYVTLKDHQDFQMHIQLLITLTMIGYLICYPPYESRALNIIEQANEWIVLACQYFMMTFIFDLDTDALRNKLGLGFSILVIIQLVVSFIALILTKIIKAWPQIKQIIQKISAFIKKKCAQRQAAKKAQEEFDHLQKIEEEMKENAQNIDNMRSSKEVLSTKELLEDNNRKNKKIKVLVDLESEMPHNFDNEDNMAMNIIKYEQTADYRNYAEWVKNPNLQLNQNALKPLQEKDHFQQLFDKEIIEEQNSNLIQQELSNNNQREQNLAGETSHDRILREYNQQKQERMHELQDQNALDNQSKEAQQIMNRVTEALEYFTSQNIDLRDPRKSFTKKF